MIDVTANVHAEATATEAWELISDFEGEWEPSNPEHKGTEVLTEPKQPLRDGLRWWQREGVGPLTGELTATVHDTRPGRAFSWTGEAIYKPFGMCQGQGRRRLSDRARGRRCTARPSRMGRVPERPRRLGDRARHRHTTPIQVGRLPPHARRARVLRWATGGKHRPR